MSITARGYRAETQIDFEKDFKVSPTTKAGKIMPINTNALTATQNLNSTNTLTGTRNDSEPFLGHESVAGDIAVPLDVRAIGHWLKGIFGAPTTTAVVGQTGMYSHVFKVKDDQPSMVIQKGFKDIGQYYIYNGCKINTLSLPIGSDSEAVATINVMGSKETQQTTKYDTTATEVKLDRVYNSQCSVKIGGTEIGIIKTGNIKLDCGLDGDQYCIGDNNTRGDIPEGIFKPSGDITALFKDNAFVDKAKNGTVDSLEVIYTKDTKSLSFKFPEIMYQRTSPAVSGKTGVSCSMNWQGFYDSDSAASACVVTLVNDVASYA